jgi:DNA-binding LacI/PurR family transcriptional regulator
MNLPNEAPSSAPGEDAIGEVRFPKKLGDLHKTITMAQIAKAAGVSQGAISSLLNDRDYGIRVSEKTRERVFKVCREMGYIPNDLRAVVRMYPEFGDCCLLIPSSHSGGLTDLAVARLAGAAMSAVSDPQRAITITTYDESIDYLVEPEALPQPVRGGVCSKFLCLGAGSHLLLQALLRRGSPVASLGHDAALPGVISIVPDYAQASRLAIEHLYQLGHRHIGIVSGPFGATDWQLLELNRGVRLACDELGMTLDPRMIIYGDLSAKSGRVACEEFFTHEPAPTAVFCLSDAAAAGVLAGAHDRGMRVPRELSVIGCGDDLCAQFTYPALTTMQLPAEEMAALGVKEIEQRVREPILGDAKKVLLPVRLIERETTGALSRV